MKEHELLESVGGINSRYVEESEKSYSTVKRMGFFHIPRVAAAAIALCVCMTGITVLASTGVFQGFFKDIFSWNGAVVGTTYENASDELNVTADYENGKLIVTVKAVDPSMAPYIEMETIRIKSYKIVDTSGKVIADNQSSDSVEFQTGEASIIIAQLSDYDGEYQLLISEFEGGKKADQPLPISGEWECNFSATK